MICKCLNACQHTFSKTSKTPLVSTNLTQKQSQDVQLEFLHHHIKFHLDQMKNVRENDGNRFCFMLTLWPAGKVKIHESGIKWQKSMVPISMAGMNKFGYTAVQCFAELDGWAARWPQPASQTNITHCTDLHDTHLDQKEISTFQSDFKICCHHSLFSEI